MSDPRHAPGDVVQCISGGPHRIVESSSQIDGAWRYACVWFMDNGRHNATFAEHTIRAPEDRARPIGFCRG